MPRWTAIPAARSSAPVLKIRLYAVMGTLVFAAVCGIIALIVALGSRPAAVESTPVAEQPVGTAIATIAARQYVAGQPITVPASPDLEADEIGGGKPLGGVGSVTWEGYKKTSDAGRTVEDHSFLLTGGAGASTFRLVVPIQIVSGQGVLVAVPSIETVPVLGTVPERFDWSNAPNLQEVTPQLQRQIEAWATAYLANDRAALQAVTGDQAARTYAGLGGFAATKTVVGAVAPRADGQSVARAQITASGPGGWTSQLEYDLLVTSATTGAPFVVAWGPAGSGGSLVAYQNALSGSR